MSIATDDRETEWHHVSVVCRHLALVAIDGATDEVALTLSPGFRLHLDDLDTDRAGYLALIAANHASQPSRPPLDVVTASAAHGIVTACLEPRCLAHFRIVSGTIREMWLTTDWQVWPQRVLDADAAQEW